MSSDVPEVVTKYKAPTSLGKNFGKFIVEYAGDLYQIPAPVSVFEKNSWKIIAEESDVAVKAKSFGWVTIMKDNQKLKVIANNYADSATTINNCFVTSVKGDDNTTDLAITVQNKITRGMKQKDLEKALTGMDFEKDDSSSTFTYYTIVGPDSDLDYVQILVRTDTSVVQAIEVNNQPKADKLFK